MIVVLYRVLFFLFSFPKKYYMYYILGQWKFETGACFAYVIPFKLKNHFQLPNSLPSTSTIHTIHTVLNQSYKQKKAFLTRDVCTL
jgi:hypothetical protein